jgi:FkbM family methyltransferase
VDRYTTTRRLMRPVTAWRRRRMEHQPLPFNRAVFEAQAYRPAMRRFFHAAHEDPELLIDVDLPEGAVVLDVGAYQGQWSGRVLARADARGPSSLRLHAFEPEPGIVEQLHASLGGDERVVIHPFGLAGADRAQELTLAGPGSTLFGTGSTREVIGTKRVPLRDVDAVLRELGIERVDLAMVNIEGGEFELIDRLHETGWLARTGTMLVQFHEFAPRAHAGRRRNRRQLGATHRCTWAYPWVFERWDPR